MTRHERSATEGVDEIVESLLGANQDRLTTRVRLPPAADLEVYLVPLSRVRDLDELRSAANGWLASASVSGSIAIGIVVNWLTESPWVPSIAAIVVLAVFATIAGLSLGIGGRTWQKARAMRTELLRRAEKADDHAG